MSDSRHVASWRWLATANDRRRHSGISHSVRHLFCAGIAKVEGSEREAGGTSYWAARDLWGVLIGAAAASGVIVLWSPVAGRFIQSTVETRIVRFGDQLP